VAKKILKINTKTKRAHNFRGAAATATGHSRAISGLHTGKDSLLKYMGTLLVMDIIFNQSYR